MTLGSLFDGIGGFPFVASMYGITPVWASEIEAAPISITKRHFPGMKHLGDITQINGTEIAPVNIVSFGSPCQDLSVAGKRAGLEGKRSGLFMEAVRIVREMRETTGGKYPNIAIWENVPGAFSSNNGEDFRAVLEELASIQGDRADIPRPPGGAWADAGYIVGNGFSLAWRVLDAQHMGVPQRRRRIYLILAFDDLTGKRAAEILFKPDSERRYLTPSGAPWKRFAGNVKSSADDVSVVRMRSGCDGGGKGALIGNDVSHTLQTGNDQTLFAVATQQGGAEIRQDDVCPTVTAAAGMSGNNQPYIAAGFDGSMGANAGNIGYEEELSPTLTVGKVMNCVHSICIQGNMVDRETNCNGKGWSDDVAETLNTQDHHAVMAFDTTQITSPENGNQPKYGDPCHPLCANAHVPSIVDKVFDARGNGDGNVAPCITGDHQNRVTDYTALCIGNGQVDQTRLTDKAGTLNCMHDQQAVITCQNTGQGWWNESDTAATVRTACGGDSVKANLVCAAQSGYTVRRLTPTECERLQGFPDGYTEYGADGKISDAARYKALGNSLALPCVDYVIRGILEVSA